jgi:hypothetical protein
MMTPIHFDDLTAINVPLAMLDDDTRERLKAHGGPWDVWECSWETWKKNPHPIWWGGLIYRVKPLPVLVTLYWHKVHGPTAPLAIATHKITFDPVTLTATVEKL